MVVHHRAQPGSVRVVTVVYISKTVCSTCPTIRHCHYHDYSEAGVVLTLGVGGLLPHHSHLIIDTSTQSAGQTTSTVQLVGK